MQLTVVEMGSGEVREHFESAAPFWEAIYGGRDVYSTIFQERMATSLSLFDMAAIPPRSRVLEVGCGAGFNTVEIARRGHRVEAVDVAPQMLALARKRADEAGVGQLVRTGQCDVRHLPFPDGSFQLVMAIGVLPWLPTLHEPLKEMVRVLRPGGHLILSVDNSRRMNYVADPAAWVRPTIIRMAAALGACERYSAPRLTVYSVAGFDAELPKFGLEKRWGATLGFGPFWLIEKLMPRPVGLNLHRLLQRLADKRIPILQSAGSHYITLSRKVDRPDG